MHDISDEQVDAYLKAQRAAVEEADRFGRPNAGGLHTNTVREACRAGLRAASEAIAAPSRPALSEHWHIKRIDKDRIHVEADGMASATVSVMSFEPLEMLLANMAEELLASPPPVTAPHPPWCSCGACNPEDAEAAREQEGERHSAKENGDCPHWCKACANEREAREASATGAEPPTEFKKTFPDHIWLDAGEAMEFAEPCDTFRDLQEVTWSEDNATGYGVKYVRADLATPTSAPVKEKP